MQLYNNPISANAKRARVAAYEFGVPVELVPVDFMKAEHKAPDYMDKNPNGKVPTLVDGDFVLWESAAMLIYWAHKYPEKNLLAKDARGIADTMRWMFWNSNHFESNISQLVQERMVKKMMKQEPDEARVQHALKDLERFAKVLDAQLSGKSWLLGEQFSVADIAVGIAAENGVRVAVDWSPYPNITAWLARLQARDSWKKASA